MFTGGTKTIQMKLMSVKKLKSECFPPFSLRSLTFFIILVLYKYPGKGGAPFES